MAERMEHRLAVMTVWAWLGSFSLCLVLTGFRIPNIVVGLGGFALLLAAGSAHVVLNRIYHTRFSEGEVALGFTVFAVAVLTFVFAWLLVPDFGLVRIAIGLIGFAGLFATFVFLLVTSFGVRGTIRRIDAARRRPLLTRR